MPLYEYECESCGQRLERIHKFSDPPLEECPKCGGHLRKLPSSPAIQFKGSGFYITDYARKSESSGTSGSSDRSEKAEKSEKSGETGKTESGEKGSSDSTKAAKSESSSSESKPTDKPSSKEPSKS